MENIVLEKINFVNGSAGKTPLNSNNMNAIQQNIENAINEVVPIITGIEENTENNINDLLATKQFIENSMKTLETEGSSIHVEDSADYPCKLRVEGKSEQVQTEQGKNLLPFKDINFTLKGVNFYTENGNLYLNGASTGEILTNDNAYITYFSFILPVGTYKFKHFSSLNVNMAIQLKKVSDKSELASINLNSNTVKTFTLDKETEVYLGIYIYNQNFNSENLKLMLSIEDATEYEPFVPDSPSPNYPSKIENVSGDLEVKATGENIFDSSLLTQVEGYNTYDEETGMYTTSPIGSFFRSIFYSVAGSSVVRDITKIIDIPKSFCDKNITIKIFDFVNNNPEYTANNRLNLAFIDENGNSIIAYNTPYIEDKKDILYTFSVPTQKCYLDIRRSDNNGTVSFSKIQIVEGSYTAETMPKFEEYKEQVVTFPLGEQKLMKDGYLGENGVVNKRKQIVLTGTENWSKRTNKNNSFNFYIDKQSMSGISTHYLPFIASNEIDTQNGIYLLNTLAIIITDLRFTDVTEFKTWLAEQYTNGTPVIVEYELAEEQTTAYTSTQQTAYNALQKLKTYRTVTNISNSQDTNMQLTYKMDLQTQIAGGGSSA